MKIFKGVIGVIIISTLSSCGDPCRKVYGHWKIYKYVGAGIVGLSNEEAQAFIGQEFILHKEYAVLNGEKFEHPQYTLQEEQADDYFYYGYRMPEYRKHLGIKEKVIKILIVSSSQPGGSDYDFILQEDEMITGIDGVFFFLRKRPARK